MGARKVIGEAGVFWKGLLSAGSNTSQSLIKTVQEISPEDMHGQSCLVKKALRR